MLILHDSAISRSKILVPVPKKDWMPSSLSSPRDQFGNETVKYMFAISAKSNDGYVIWKGWFENREDFDAFLFAIFKGTLKSERALWDLPTPNWQPYLGELITYEFATFGFLTSAGSVLTYNVPSDFNPEQNKIHCVGAGGFGGNSDITTQTAGQPVYVYVAAGGGGGAYSRSDNVVLTPGGSANYFVAASGTTSVSPNTWFNAASGSGACRAESGNNGLNTKQKENSGDYGTPTTIFQSFGGASGNCIGNLVYSGGNGSNNRVLVIPQVVATAGYLEGGGGGGGAGPYGAGGAGANTGGGGGADGGYSASTSDGYGANNRLNQGGSRTYYSQFGSSSDWNGVNGAGGNKGYFENVSGAPNNYSDKGRPGSMETTASYFSTSYGIGGGGGGGSFFWRSLSERSSSTGGAGGSYGGGGGSAAGHFKPSSANTSWRLAGRITGGQGLIVVEYEPQKIAGFNSPMLGM